MLVVGGLHGNEPAGVHAIRRVLEQLERRRPQLRGELLAISGNRRALAAGRRYIDRDLNRAWTPAQLSALRRRGPAPDIAEEAEQLEILELVDDLEQRCGRPLTILDLHTTSAPGAPFVGMGDSYRNRRLASALPIPTIIGLDELVAGAMLAYLHDLGHVGVSIEGGQHERDDTVDRVESALWLALVAAGMLAPGDVERGCDHHRRALARVCDGLPRIVDARYRHRINPTQGFVMDPGYSSFQRVRRGQRLAQDKRGPIKAPWTGRVLMPLYQREGNDGFFMAREYSRARLWVANLLRLPLRRPLPGRELP